MLLDDRYRSKKISKNGALADVRLVIASQPAGTRPLTRSPRTLHF